MVSVFPDALNPQLLVNVWAGPPKVETGAPENVYALDKTGLTQLTKDGGDPLRAGLDVGTTYRAAGRAGLDQLRRLEALDQAADLHGARRLAGAGLGDAGRARHGGVPLGPSPPPVRPGRSQHGP